MHASVQAARPGGGDVWGTETAEDVRLDEEKLRAALRQQQAAKRERVETDERKRKYNSQAGGGEVSAEDMEAYRMTRVRGDDPMAAYLNGRSEDGGE